MDFQAIQADISWYAAEAYQISKEYVLWAGHKIQIGFSDYLIPQIKALWSWVAANFNTFRAFVHTNPGFIFSISAGIFLCGIAAFKIADHKAYEDDLLAKTAWKTVGIFAFVGATLFTSFGIAALTV